MPFQSAKAAREPDPATPTVSPTILAAGSARHPGIVRQPLPVIRRMMGKNDVHHAPS